MNLEHAVNILSADEFEMLLEKAWELGPEREGFKIENVRKTGQGTTAHIQYEGGEERDITLTKNSPHM